MWEDVLTSAIYGAIGGGGGALIGGLLALPFSQMKAGQHIRTILTVAGAVLGINLARPALEPYIGEYLPKSDQQEALTSEFDAMMVELQEYPIVVAILEKEPSVEGELKSRLTQILNEGGGPVNVRQSAFTTSFNYIQSKFVYYIARFTDEDLVRFVVSTNEGLQHLSATDPQYCFDSLYNPGALAAMNVEQIKAKVGISRFDQQQHDYAEMIRSAHKEIPEYDQNAAAQTIAEVVEILKARLGDNIGLVTLQQAPENTEEAKLACDATIELYASILEREDRIPVLRHMFR